MIFNRHQTVSLQRSNLDSLLYLPIKKNIINHLLCTVVLQLQ